MAEYTPGTDEIRAVWAAWSEYGGLTSRAEDATDTERYAEFDRWLASHDARVRRDAAREALDGLADEVIHVDWDLDGPAFALRVRRFKNRKYPEEAP